MFSSGAKDAELEQGPQKSDPQLFGERRDSGAKDAELVSTMYAALRRRGEAGLHNVLLTKVVKDLKAHFVPACHREHPYACGIELGTKALLRVQTETFSLPDRSLCLGRLAVFHSVTPRRVCPKMKK